MEYKSFPVTEMKATADADQPGTFEAIVAVFGNVDDSGDRIERGAFTDSLAKGLPPVVWSHEWGTPPIGTTLEARETDEGLYVKARLFVADDEDAPMARAAYTAMKALDGRGQPTLREFSFGYAVRDSEDVDGIRRLKALDVFEVGPTLKGMNPATRLLGVKQSGGEIHITLSGDTAAQKKEPTDNSEPNSTVVDEEARTRINALLLARPIHT